MFYEPGYSYTAPLTEENLVKVSNAYDEEIKKNPNLSKYKTRISLQNSSKGIKISIVLTDKNTCPWKDKYILREGEFKDGKVLIDLSDI